MLSDEKKVQIQEQINAHKTTISNSQASLQLDPKHRTHKDPKVYDEEASAAQAEIDKLQDILNNPDKYTGDQEEDELYNSLNQRVADLETVLEPNGILAKSFENFEQRIQKLENAKPAAFTPGGGAAGNPGTGTGN